MDKLDNIFEKQKTLNDRIEKSRNINFDMSMWVQKEILAMISELSEVLDEVNFKWWKNEKEINMDNLKEEVVDVFHFFVSLCQKIGMSSSELYEIYCKKNTVNHDRQNGLTDKEGYKI